MNIPVGAKEVSIEAEVIRCTCGNPQSHVPNPCPQGVSEGNKVVAYWHKNPIKRAIGQFRIRMRQ